MKEMYTCNTVTERKTFQAFVVQAKVRGIIGILLKGVKVNRAMEFEKRSSFCMYNSHSFLNLARFAFIGKEQKKNESEEMRWLCKKEYIGRRWSKL